MLSQFLSMIETFKLFVDRFYYLLDFFVRLSNMIEFDVVITKLDL